MSMEALAPLLAKRAPSSDVLLLAARAAMALGRPGEAADALTRLAETRSLTTEEAVWRAGAYRQAERYEEARRAYAQLAQTAPPQEAVPSGRGRRCGAGQRRRTRRRSSLSPRD